MGLLQEIYISKQTLWIFEHGNLDNFPASDIKLNIIQNSIYGVDIEKGAVDIARLRFWLSLIVDEDEPKSLPNLDYKIVVGNSLISLFQGIELLHSNGYAHFDIKPVNILTIKNRDNTFKTRLIDFDLLTMNNSIQPANLSLINSFYIYCTLLLKNLI